MPLLAKGQRSIMIECPCCGASTQYVTMVAVAKPHDHEAPLSRPASTMRGMGRLVDADPPPFWGCGECGSVWHEERDFQTRISRIVARHPYRADSYKRIEGKWLPAGPDVESADHEERIGKEP
ncbi:hypothetical protein JR064_03440 [Xanthomonas sp. CFBP 8703]|uniref:Uncharacterized protein n=1 Tax=Xanthomonas bonasiae TaxID=2810351 RepID=A0ABS3AXY8_9XANT|nr:hypothetical protein [Xanthomonas bonasiae]MBN6101217.1 hypothetical protein [Xanthomonas bonasiae]